MEKSKLIELIPDIFDYHPDSISKSISCFFGPLFGFGRSNLLTKDQIKQKLINMKKYEPGLEDKIVSLHHISGDWDKSLSLHRPFSGKGEQRYCLAYNYTE